MAKGRMLQNRISKSSKMAALSNDTVRLLYTWLLSHLDVNGNFYADPTMVNNIVFTRLNKSVKTITGALDELEEKGLIVRYTSNDDIYLNYPDFYDKQPKINPSKEGKPEIPNITPEQLQSNSRVTPPQEKLKEDKRSRENKFTPPLLNDVIKYFQENGYSVESAKKAFKYYNSAEWKDSKGNQVKNWKQKMIGVWFKDENKAKTGSTQFEPTKPARITILKLGQTVLQKKGREAFDMFAQNNNFTPAEIDGVLEA